MGRNSVSPEELDSPPLDDALAGGGGDLPFRSNFVRFKRTHPHNSGRPKLSDRHLSGGGRFRSRRRSFQFKGNSMIYGIILLAVFGFALASMVLQSSITSVFRQSGGGRAVERRALTFGTALRFVAPKKFQLEGRLDQLRMENRSGLRPPKLAVILGNMKMNPEALMLFTVMKNLQHIGYMLKLYALEDGEARTKWEEIGGQLTIFNLERYGRVDWSLFEGVIVDSLEAKEVISSLMQEPFCSVPLVWIIQEDSLAKRLLHYNRMNWEPLISHWRHVFCRADVVVFPDFSLPMLYSSLDCGNFFVIPGSPIDVWAAESYAKRHSKINLRKSNGYNEDDMLVLVLGSSVFYSEVSLDYAVAMHTIGPLLTKYAKEKDDNGSIKFIFLCANATDGYNDTLEGVTARLRLKPGSLRHYSMDHDVNGVILMADIVLYGSSHEAFPSLLIRAMSFGIPIIVPDVPVTRKYIVDGVHGMIFAEHNPDDLLRVFSILLANGVLSKFGSAVGSAGKLLARNLLASESISGYAKLLENILSFPSDALLPAPISQIHQDSWDWKFFSEVIEPKTKGEENNVVGKPNVVIDLEEEFCRTDLLKNNPEDNGDAVLADVVSAEDLDDVEKIASFEEFQRREMDQINERTEKDPGSWDEIYRNARKSEKLRFEANERDEGELQRTGRSICIYEVYGGAGAWPLLHHGSMYRGLSLSRRTRRLGSDDVDAVYRLPLLNNSRYHNLLCEMGGMLSVAYKVDEIHKRPWIGFQSWRASGREVSLSIKAEKILEETIQRQTQGDVMYFWIPLDLDHAVAGRDGLVSFWSICDALNAGHCRFAFEKAFRNMYGLPSNFEALPPMPEDSDHWSALHSWVMPTSSFLEFIMFTRMFVDSLDAVHDDTVGMIQCPLGWSELERKNCYCRILELLVNVWAYHSARTMIFIDPQTGVLKEQHPVEKRKGKMWVKYFNFTLLKSMDEDLAEAADDGDLQRESWLWPLTGEVFWQGIYEREREQRYRIKMDKKRKLKEKLFERMKYGYKQKSLGG
ncbi:hypothetical protein RND81_07G168600 [Saponaria officinalis]|uniref:Glycosyl transferase family 1 domain-containing protein n=1 Tax=Saponaria officinalis TaxID=3572 RepID=A0AAW1JPA4_SAPOF